MPRLNNSELKYLFKVDDIDVSQSADDSSRFLVRGNILMIGHRREEATIQVTCVVYEDNIHPSNVSRTEVFDTHCEFKCYF